MGRPITLFTGQWTDLPLEDVVRKAAEFGYQGLELACWGDHFDVERVLGEESYCAERRDLLERYDLQLHALSADRVGQCVLDPISERHRAILADARLGRWRAGRGQRTSGRGAEEHGTSRAKDGGGDRQRFHRIEHLARAVCLSFGESGDDRCRL